MPSISAPPAKLSLREKIGQTCQIHGKDLEGLRGEALAAFFDKRPVGSIFLGSEVIGSRGDVAGKLQQMIAECQAVSRLPLSIAGDLENGAGGAIRGMTAFPNLLALGALDDPAAAYDYGRWTAVEACRVGFNWTFGPVVDLLFNWLNPVVSVRSLGQSPERVAELAAALIRGCQDYGLSATAKHFPGDGVDFRDQHFCLTVNSLPEAQWWQSFGHVFEACFRAEVHAVMAGHIALPWMERRTGSEGAPLPSTTSSPILSTLLRERMGYEGVVVSDALIMAGFRGMAASREELIVEAFNAGIDVMLWPGEDYFEIMERAIDRGRISEERLNQSVERILAMKARQEAKATLSTTADGALRMESLPVGPMEPMGQEAGAIRFAHDVAEGSLTLVKNSRGLLPLDPVKTRRVQILLGTPREEGAEARFRPLLEGMRARGIAVDLHINGNCLDLRRKEESGERYDALIAIFELSTHSIKNTMRPTGPMAECMWTIQGLETMHPIIISLGSPYLLNDMPWAETCINAYSPNPYTLHALNRALFGDIPIRGISPVEIEVSWTMPDGQCFPETCRSPKIFPAMISPRLLFLAFILLALPVHAATWVVANRVSGAADTNSGTLQKPLLTINAAAQRARPGDTVLVCEGVYRERVAPQNGGTEGQPIIYQAASGQSVAIKGSDIWAHWKPVAGHPGVFTAEIEGHLPAGSPNPFAIGISIAPKDLDLVARPTADADKLPRTLGQIFFDGRPVVESDSEKTVLAQENAWVVTADGKQLLAHFPGNPATLSNRLVEVSTRNRIFAPRTRGLSHIHVKGFVMEHCANQGPFPQAGALSPRSGSHWLIEGNTIRFAKTIGMDVGSETWDAKLLKETVEEQKVRMNGGGHLVEGNTVSDNGLCGIAGWQHNVAVIRNNIVERNNALGFGNYDATWEEWGGIKLHGGAAIIEGNLVRGNDGYGIWLDADYTGARLSRNVVLNNRSAGIFLELGDGRALIDNNIVGLTRPRDEMYAGMGIYAHDASGLVIAHNLIFGNADCGVLLRTVSDRIFPAPGKPGSRPVHTSDTRILNNIIWNNSKPAICLPYPNERAGENLSDYNVLYGSRDLWLGFEPNPSLFGVNLYKSSIKIDQLVASLKDVLEKGGVPREEWPNLKAWRRNPTLTLMQWRLLMGQDLHSKETPKLVTLVLRPELPMISYKAEPAVLQMQCPPVEGVERDFLGEKLPASNIRPGPFQNISQTETEQVLFPVRP